MMTEKQLIARFKIDPEFFINQIWKLESPIIKKEYEEIIKQLIESNNYSEIKKYHFEPYKENTITWQQWVILQMVKNAIDGKAPNRISIVSGHGTGKSSCLSWLIIWFLFCHIDAQVACTAPTTEQIHDVLWKEIAKWLYKMPKELADLFDWSNQYVRVKEKPETWFARAKTARKEAPEALAGMHGEHMFFAIDESSGVADEIFRTAEGSLTGKNVLVLMISNGTRNDGYFYDSHHNDRHNYQILSLSSEDSPIVEKGFIERIIERYGKDSDEYRIRVSGQFPNSSQMDDKGWIPLLTAEQITVATDFKFFSKKILGVDPAGDGDDKSLFVIRDKYYANVVAREQQSTSKSIAIKILTLKDHYELDKKDILIDNFGVGANVAVELAMLGTKSNPINWSEPNEQTL